MGHGARPPGPIRLVDRFDGHHYDRSGPAVYRWVEIGATLYSSHLLGADQVIHSAVALTMLAWPASSTPAGPPRAGVLGLPAA